jgi:hypothetical protein
MLRDGLTEPSPELRKLQARWANPAFPSPVSRADALVKIAPVLGDWLGRQRCGVGAAGFTDSQITRLASDRKRAESSAFIAALDQSP